MMTLHRRPDGVFAGAGEMLSAWLPSFLSATYYNPLETMLTYAARWCAKKAGEELKWEARRMELNPNDSGTLEFHGVASAKQWSARRDILRGAITQLKELK